MQWIKRTFKLNCILSGNRGITLYQVSMSCSKKNREKLFCNRLIISAREKLGMEGWFYTNGLELKHKLQKKQMAEGNIPKEATVVTAKLQN